SFNYLAPLARSIIPGIKIGLCFFSRDGEPVVAPRFADAVKPENWDYLCVDRYCNASTSTDFDELMAPAVDYAKSKGKRLLVSETAADAQFAVAYYTSIRDGKHDDLLDGVIFWFGSNPRDGHAYKPDAAGSAILDTIATHPGFGREFDFKGL